MLNAPFRREISRFPPAAPAIEGRSSNAFLEVCHQTVRIQSLLNDLTILRIPPSHFAVVPFGYLPPVLALGTRDDAPPRTVSREACDAVSNGMDNRRWLDEPRNGAALAVSGLIVVAGSRERRRSTYGSIRLHPAYPDGSQFVMP